MPTFDITRPIDTAKLDVDGKGTIPFTVTNVSGTAVKARLSVVPGTAADAPLFTLEGGEERNLRPNDTINLRVSVATTPSTPPGAHKRRARRQVARRIGGVDHRLKW